MTNQIIVQLNPDVPPTGSDLGIVNAARKSFGRRSEWANADDGFRPDPHNPRLKYKDKRLLEFLARGMTVGDFDSLAVDITVATADGDYADYQEQKELLWQWRNTPTHDTPFNHGFFSFEVKAPMFVARHLVKHEYLIMSEYSRRYITDDVEFYTPDVWRKAATDVKQGSSDEAVTHVDQGCGHDGCCPPDGNLAVPIIEYTDGVNEMLTDTYETLIEAGVAPEQARMVLPQSLMTSWTWSGTLGAFANMCKLRLSKDTQYETRLVAQGVYAELKKQFPISAPLLVEGVL